VPGDASVDPSTILSTPGCGEWNVWIECPKCIQDMDGWWSGAGRGWVYTWTPETNEGGDGAFLNTGYQLVIATTPLGSMGGCDVASKVGEENVCKILMNEVYYIDGIVM